MIFMARQMDVIGKKTTQKAKKLSVYKMQMDALISPKTQKRAYRETFDL